jgi:replicative DNA helicase
MHLRVSVTPGRDQSFGSMFIVDAELPVLAMPFWDPARITDVAAALEGADFAGEANRIIYEAMLRLHSAGKPIDVTLVVGELGDADQYNGVRRFSGNVC